MAVNASPTQPAAHAAGDAVSPFWRKLLRRWLVEYNPLYLLSAMLVLAGVILMFRGLAHEGGILAPIGVSAIAEVYAWALVLGAALLTRAGLRRPGVMLALLAALYQGDLTLHTETAAWLGTIGVFTTFGWLVLFWAKLHVLAWAVRIRLSASAVALPMAAALGLAVFPYVLHEVDGPALGALVAAWLFALFAFGLWTSRHVGSLIPLDGWGEVVLRRALRATWGMWAVLVLCHVAFWASESKLSLAVLLPVALVLATRWLRSHVSVLAFLAVGLLAVGVVLPAHFSLAAALSAAMLVLRALRHPFATDQAARPAEAAGPYRTPADADTRIPGVPPDAPWRPADPLARQRLFAGAVVSAYLALWTIGWTSGRWPEHVLPLDLAFSGAVGLLFWKAQARAVLLPLAGTWLHVCARAGIVSLPETTLQWGISAVGLGFASLFVSLAASLRFRDLVAADAPASAEASPAPVDVPRN